MTRQNLPLDATCDANDLRLMMRKVASTVAVITSHGPDGPAGITATSIASVAMSPPSIVVCVNQATRLHRAVTSSGLFRVNYLAKSQGPVAQAFGGVFDGDRFSCGTWDCAAQAGPSLAASLGGMTCSVSDLTEFGTHSVFIGLVSTVLMGEHTPLVYCNGDYVSVGAMNAA